MGLDLHVLHQGKNLSINVNCKLNTHNAERFTQFDFGRVCDICFLSPCDIINAEVSQMSSKLSSESRVFADKAKDLNRQVQCSNISPADTFCFERLPNCRLALKAVPSFSILSGLHTLNSGEWLKVFSSKGSKFCSCHRWHVG
jgi:hypothetical protein